MYHTQGEERRLKRQYASEVRALTDTEKNINAITTLATTLEEQVKQHQIALATVDTDLAAAKQEVERLESVWAAMLKEAAEAAIGAEQARSKLSTLITELSKKRENTTVRNKTKNTRNSVLLQAWFYAVNLLIGCFFGMEHELSLTFFLGFFLFVQLVEQALDAARVRSRDVDRLVNPLNHPLIKSLMQQ